MCHTACVVCTLYVPQYIVCTEFYIEILIVCVLFCLVRYTTDFARTGSGSEDRSDGGSGGSEWVW